MAGHLQLYDSGGQRVLLGHQLGVGGEGAVFEVQGAPRLAAKWYKHQPSADKASKLRAMAHVSDAALTSIAAWPIGTLHKTSSGPLVGFLMPKVSGYRPIHELYSPAQRKFCFPKADWAFLVHTARNVASAVAGIHARGYVLGDINQGNVLVAPNATVTLIDCDSFQVRVNGRHFLCEVGVPEFTPPELHGRGTFSGVIRTPNHDAFGLAVLIFHLLFMGRHPFAGRFLGRGDKPIDDAIREFRFAFGQAAASRGMTAPPYSLNLLQTSAEIASLFERAFAESAVRDGTRPTAQEWLGVLDRFRVELVACKAVPAHKIYRSLTKCPWCEIQRNGGPDFFISVTIETAARFGATFDLAKAWAAISRIAAPDVSAIVMPKFCITGTPNPVPPYLGFTRTQAVCLRFGAFAVAGATVAGLPLVASVVLTLGVLALHYYAPNRRERRKRQRAIRALSHSATAKREEWSRLARAFQQQFAGKLNELRESKEKYALLSTARQRDLERSERERETYQRKEFLERHFIKDYGIEGVGPGRRATLLSYGIETFYDVTPRAIDQVPGFGPALTSTLLGWRKRIETQFRFDQKKGVNPAAVAAIDRKYALERVPLEKRLLGGPQELTSIHRAAAQERSKIEEETAQLVRTMGQAKANVAAKEGDWWVAVLCVVLLLGFILRLAVSGTTRLASPQAIGQALESPGGPRSWGDSSPADANQPERAICQ